MPFINFLAKSNKFPKLFVSLQSKYVKKRDNAIVRYVYETEIIRANATGKTWDSAEEFSHAFYWTDRVGYGLLASVGQPQRHFHR